MIDYSDEEKLKVYIRIVRLLLEEEEPGLAETYYTRAAVLIHSTNDKTLQLQYKLCQARLADFTRKFVDAATRYHELSWIGDIDEEERLQALYVISALTSTALPGPASETFPLSHYSCLQHSSCDLCGARASWS